MSENQLDAVFGALADPTRRAILARLAEGDVGPGTHGTVQRLPAGHLEAPPRARSAGLISRSRKATARLSHLEADPLRTATEWLVGYREYWEESHERLDALLAALQVDHRERKP